MFVDYSPEGQAAQRFDFRPGRVRLSEAQMIEFAYKKLAGEPRTFAQFVDDVKSGSAPARRVLLHHLLRKQHPTIRIEDVDPLDEEIVTVFNKAEIEEMRAMAEKSSALTEAERTLLLSRLDDEIASAPDAETPGKAGGTLSTDREQ